MNVLTSITANSPKVEINNHHLVNKQNVVYSYDEISFNHEKEVLIYNTTWLNLENITVTERSQS